MKSFSGIMIHYIYSEDQYLLFAHPFWIHEESRGFVTLWVTSSICHSSRRHNRGELVLNVLLHFAFSIESSREQASCVLKLKRWRWFETAHAPRFFSSGR